MIMLCNDCTHDVLTFGVVHFSKKGYQRNGTEVY